MRTQNPGCDGDHCATSTGTVATLRLPGDSNLHLCRACWAYEMRWRALRNDELEEFARYPILNFDEAKEYLP